MNRTLYGALVVLVLIGTASIGEAASLAWSQQGDSNKEDYRVLVCETPRIVEKAGRIFKIPCHRPGRWTDHRQCHRHNGMALPQTQPTTKGDAL